MKILGIETSCDETAAAVIEDGRRILSNVIASQIDLHAKYGGVVPEVAARSHIGEIIPVIEQALQEANVTWADIDAIAVTRGPGLIGSLLIGTLTAQTLGELYNKPVVGVNHVLAHAFASFLLKEEPDCPMLALIVSGGHTQLMLFQNNLDYDLLGETRDDAAGEAFDKVSKLLGLPYPGGPSISKAAEKGNPRAFKFPIADLGKDSLDFSFSGLKTAVLRQVQELTGINPGAADHKKTYQLPEQLVSDIAASFQATVTKTLVQNTVKAYEKYKPASVVIGGGVAANQLLRQRLLAALPQALFVPPVLCTDNAAMIAVLGFKMLENQPNQVKTLLKADSSLEVI